jgi:hypothetical protein
LGISCVFLLVIVFLWTSMKVLSTAEPQRYNSIFAVYRMIMLLVILSWCWGGNLWVWTTHRINYSFILRFNIRTHIRWQHLIEYAAYFTMFWLASILLYLLSFLAPKPVFGWMSSIPYQVFPLTLLVAILVLAIVQQLRSKFWLVKCLFRIVFSPLYKVEFLDFFMAEQLCSLVILFYDLEYSICFFVSDAWTNGDACAVIWPFIRPILVVVPYIFRMVQCIKIYKDTREFLQLINVLKYISAMALTAIATVYYYFQGQIVLLTFYICAGVIGGGFGFYWDVAHDWGLGHRTSKNKFLRDNIRFSKWVYWVAIVSNFLLRMGWVLTISPMDIYPIEGKEIIALLGALEVLRRGQWNIFALENKQLSNAKLNRAVRDLELPLVADGNQFELKHLNGLSKRETLA